MSAHKPYTVERYGDEPGRFSSFDGMLAFAKSLKNTRALDYINYDRADADYDGGSWRYYDGLTEDERETLENEGVL